MAITAPMAKVRITQPARATMDRLATGPTSACGTAMVGVRTASASAVKPAKVKLNGEKPGFLTDSGFFSGIDEPGASNFRHITPASLIGAGTGSKIVILRLAPADLDPGGKTQ